MSLLFAGGSGVGALFTVSCAALLFDAPPPLLAGGTYSLPLLVASF
ncbi:hypothetical protein ACFFIF_08990 [Vagococcus entomophilus]|nr:hypothetical protein [Vagococcus entomophilus]